MTPRTHQPCRVLRCCACSTLAELDTNAPLPALLLRLCCLPSRVLRVRRLGRSMNPRPPAGASLTGCCGIRPKPLKPPTSAAPPTRAARNFIDPEDTAGADEYDDDVEPVYAASRRRAARGDAPGNAAPAGADRGEEDDGEDGAAGAAGARRSGGAGGASFFAPSAAAAGRDHVAVIQGASRGIGLELVRQLLERPDLKARSGALAHTAQCTQALMRRVRPIPHRRRPRGGHLPRPGARRGAA